MKRLPQFETLLKKYAIQEFNLLQIDTEGYDFEILKTVNLKIHQPDIILYEYVHLPLKDMWASLKYLKQHQYHLLYYERDII